MKCSVFVVWLARSRARFNCWQMRMAIIMMEICEVLFYECRFEVFPECCCS